jgi:hypothetical protein
MNNEQIASGHRRIESRSKGLRREVTAMAAKLGSIADYVAQQKGARRATIGIATASASVAALIVSTLVAVFFK